MQPLSLLRRVVTSLSSLMTLALLGGAVPVALWKLAAWPLPSGVPSLSEVAHALTANEISDSTLFKTLALLGWIAWLQIAVSILVESAAWARGRASPHLRFVGPAQPAIGRLVTSAALILSLARVSHGAVPTLTPVATATEGVPAATHTSVVIRAESTAAEPARSSPSEPTKTHTVLRYETLWGLAKKHLGDPFRWRQLFEMNRGRRQPDGQRLQDPSVIDPGWVLTFPPDAIGLSATPPASAPTKPQSRRTETESRLPAPPSPSCPVPPGPPTSSSPPAESPTTASPKVVPSAGSRDVEEHDDHSKKNVDPALAIGGTLAAASLVALLERLRRVRRRRRVPGRRPPLPRPAVEQAERRLRRAADLDGTELLDVALRAFAAGLTRTRGTPPAVLAARLTDEQLELLVDEPPGRTPRGFVCTDDARGWITDPTLTRDDLRSIAAGSAAPLPALVSIGELDDGRLLIDVETAGTLTVDGEEAGVIAFLRRIAAELATSTWADHLDVLVVGAIELDVVGAQRVRQFSDIGAAIDELEATARAVNDALTSARRERTLTARLSEHHDDGWIPTIMVCTELLAEDALERLCRITGEGGRGVGAVVFSRMHATWHAELHGAELILAPLGFRVSPAVLDASSASALDELLTDAAVGDADELLDELHSAPDPPNGRAVEYVDPAFDVEIRVLGPVEVVGAANPLDRRRCIELAAYLALHPKGVSDDRLKTVLWLDQAPTTATFNTTVSTTRSRLGSEPEGTLHFPHFAASGGLYRLGPRVTTDIARLEARVAHAKECTLHAAIATLRTALELVRGKPFEGARGYEWAFSEGLIANMEATIADAAHTLAQLYLDIGDAQNATWAAMQGLSAAPGDEILYRDRMLACDLAGNPAGVETVMDELCEVVEALEPYDQLHPETLALYERISHRRRTTQRTR
jgi:DNA-binding SARP family transcriptional activator